MNVTDLGLLNINRKIIDSRKYKDNLISTVGATAIVDGNASSFDKESYLYKNNLSFKAGSTLTVCTKGVYLPSEAPQTAWKLQGTNNSVVLQLTNSKVQVLLNNTVALSVSVPTITDTLDIRININISSDKLEAIAFLNDRVYHKIATITDNINTQEFASIFIGNNPLDTDTFWKGSFTVQNFAILENNVLNYSPSTGYPISFTKILVSDGEFPLSNSSAAISDHIYEYEINEVNRSGNTVLLTSQIGEEANIIIKEIGLYAETDEGEILFSNITGLNITTGEGVPYDLVLTINTTLSFVNVIGFPDVGSIIAEDPVYCTYKDFKTVKDLTLYILTNLERLIVLNATNIGYNRAQVFYRLQREMERQENCFASVQTFTNLMQKLHRVIETIFDKDAVQIHGTKVSEASDEYITPSISEDGAVTDFSLTDYIMSVIPFNNESAWEFETAFSLNEQGSGTVAALSNDTEVQPLIESISPSLTSWNIHEPATFNLSQATYGNGKFLILDSTGKYVLLSEDGELWTTVERETYKANEQVTFGNGKFLIVSPAGYVSVSEDGKVWTPATQNTHLNSHTCNILMFQDGQFIVLSADGYISTSRDGETWTTPQATSLVGSGHTWVVGTFGNGKFITIASDNFMATSLDLINWSTPAQVEGRSGTLSSSNTLIYHNNQFILTSSNLYCSSDGYTWQYKSYWGMTGLTFNNSKYLGIYYNGSTNSLFTSTNLTTWNHTYISFPSSNPILTFGKGRFISIPNVGEEPFISNNGITWTSSSNLRGLSQGHWVCSTYGNNLFVALGVNSNSTYISTSTDGLNWLETPVTSSELSSRDNWNTIVYDGTKFLTFSYNYVSTSEDGINWSDPAQSATLPSKNWVYSVYDGTKIILVAASGYIATSTDGETWESTQISTLSSYYWYGITYDGNRLIGLLYKSNQFYVAASTDYVTWSTPVLVENIKRHGIAYGNGFLLCFGRSNPSTSLTSNSTLNLKIAKTNTITATILSDDIEYTQGSTKSVPYKYYTTSGKPNIATNNVVTDFSEGSVRVPLTTTPINSSYQEILYFTTPEQIDGEWEYPIQTAETSGFDLSLTNGTTDGYVTVEATAKSLSAGWTTPVQVGTTTWNSVAYGNGKYIALGDNGYITTSEDGVTWETPYAPEVPNFSSIYHTITYYSNKFIALGNNGYIATSNDGEEWSVIKVGEISWRGIAYREETESTPALFVITGANGYVSTSSNGVTWTTPAQANELFEDDFLRVISYGNGKFVAGSLDGYITTSTDGITWTTPIQVTGIDYWASITFGNGKFLGTSQYGKTTTSIDGVTWTTPVIVGDKSWDSSAYGNERFLIAGSRGMLATSTDGITWTTPVQIVGPRWWNNCTYGNNKFVVVGSFSSGGTAGDGGYISSSTSIGSIVTTYTNALQTNTPYYFRVSYSKDENDQYDLSYSYSLNGEDFNNLGNYTLDSYSTPEITSFSLSGPPTYSVDLNKLSVTVDENSLIQKTETLQEWTTDEEVEAYHLHTNDGSVVDDPVISPSEGNTQFVFSHRDINTTTWNMPVRIETGDINTDDYDYIAYGNDKFVALSSSGVMATSTDGFAWKSISANLGSHSWNAIAYGNSKFVALGYNGYISTSTDGETWTSATQVSNLSFVAWNSLVYGNNKLVALGLSMSTGYGTISTSTNGTTWTAATQVSNLGSRNWVGISYTNNKFVALSRDGYTSTSTDGTTWTAATRNTNMNRIWYCLTSNSSILVAIGDGGYFATSTDGETWTVTQQAALTTEQWDNIQACYGLGELHILLNKYNLGTYTSAITGKLYGWSFPEPTEGLAFDDIDAWLVGSAYIGGENKSFVALQSDGTLSASRDGSLWEKTSKATLTGDDTWAGIDNSNTSVHLTVSTAGKIGLVYDLPSLISSITTLDPSYTWEGMTYDGTKFIALANTSEISTSTDGINWSTPVEGYGGSNWRCIAYGNNTYVIVNKDGWVGYSYDLQTWQDPVDGTDIGTNKKWISIAFGSGIFVVIGDEGDIAISTDGISWTTSQPLNKRTWNSIIFDGTRFIAFSERDGKIVMGTPNSNNTITWGSDATNSTLSTLSTNNGGVYGAAYDGYRYLIMLKSSGLIYYSKDLVSAGISSSTWTLLSSSSANPNYYFKPFCYSNDTLVEVQYSGTQIQGKGRVYTTTYLPVIHTPVSITSLSSSKEWVGVTSLNNGDTYVALSSDGYTATASSSISSWTLSSTNLSESSSWKAITSSGSKLVAISSDGYVTTSTDGEYWTTPANSLGSHVWKSVVHDGNRFIALAYRGWYSISSDGVDWLEPQQNTFLEPTSDEYAWSTLAYGNNKVLALSDEMAYSLVFKDTKWKEVEPINTQYILGNAGYIEYAPIRVALKNSKLVFTPSANNLYAWSTLEGTLSDIVYTASPFPSTGNVIFSRNKRVIGEIIYAKLSGLIKVLLYENGFIKVFYRDSSNDVENEVVLSSSVNIKPNTFYDINVSFDGTKYSLSYKLDNMGDTSIYPDSEVINYYSAIPTSFGKYNSIAFGSNNNTYKFLGNIDMSKVSLQTDSYYWAGTSQLNQIYTRGITSDSNNTIYDSETYSISNVPITTNYGYILDEETFTVEPDKKYYAKITYAPASSGETWNTATHIQNFSTNSGSGYDWSAITYSSNDNKFVAINKQGYVSTSIDGKTWDNPSLSLPTDLRSIFWAALAYGNGKFVALNYGSFVSISTNGKDWSTGNDDPNLSAYPWSGLTYGNGKFVAIGDHGCSSTSINGTNWTPITQFTNISGWEPITYGNGKFVALTFRGYVSTSMDGVNWTDPIQNSNLGDNGWFTLFYGNGNFIALSYYGLISTSTDGVNWTAPVQNTDLGRHNWESAAYGNKKFVALGDTAYVSTSIADTMSYTIHKSEDGETYSEVLSRISEYAMSPVNSVYIGVEPTYDPVTSTTSVSNPFDGTVYMTDLKVMSEQGEWSPVVTVGTSEPQIIQYYNIPKYNRNMYVIEDMKNSDNTLTILDTSFTGNTDLIDFSSPIGFSLCTKVFLEDSEDKVLLVKTDASGNPYFSLTFEEQTVKFTLRTQSQDIVLSKHLENDDYASYESSPILLSVIVEKEEGLSTFSLYKNNELIDQVALGVNDFLEASASYLTNYTDNPAEAKLYVSDIIVIDGSISTDDLYYITNLTDTNF